MENEKRLIDIGKRMEEWKELLKAHYPNMPCSMFHEFILAAPTVDAVEVVHGRWISRICSYGTPKCSVCGWSIPYSEDSRLDATNYCPNCGAKMDGERRTDG